MSRYIGAGVLFIIFFSGRECCCAQEFVGVPFLLYSPSAVSNAMGETSVAVLTSDPLAPLSNPAHLGMQSLGTSFSIGGNYSELVPEQQSDISYGTIAINKCFTLKKKSASDVGLGIGVGYSRVMLSIGEFLPYPSFFDIFEFKGSSDQVAIGLGADFGVKVSAGITCKHINSRLGLYDTPLGRAKSDQGNAYDYGILFDVPVVDIVSQIVRQPIMFTPNLTPVVDLTFGFAKNNMGGGSIIYLDAGEADPLPRYARVGIGVNLGIVYTSGDKVYRPVSFKWSVEANDLLVRYVLPVYESYYDSQSGYWNQKIVADGRWEDKRGIGEIDFMSNVFFGKSNPNILKKKGWELTFFEIASIRGGRVEGCSTLGYPSFDTWGYGVDVAPIFRWLELQNPKRKVNADSNPDHSHVDVVFNQSIYTSDHTKSWFSGTTFYSLNVILTK
jgi:hypothetical protein